MGLMYFYILVFRRYVSDIFRIAQSDKIDHPLNRFNSFQEKLEFTIEYEKPTYSGRGVSQFQCRPFFFRRNYRNT